MNDLLEALIKICGEEHRQSIKECLNRHIQEYSSITHISKFHDTKLAEAILGYQNKYIASEFGEALLNNGNIKITTCDPEDYRDILSNELPEWSKREERRLAKLWVLK